MCIYNNIPSLTSLEAITKSKELVKKSGLSLSICSGWTSTHSPRASGFSSNNRVVATEPRLCPRCSVTKKIYNKINRILSQFWLTVNWRSILVIYLPIFRKKLFPTSSPEILWPSTMVKCPTPGRTIFFRTSVAVAVALITHTRDLSRHT